MKSYNILNSKHLMTAIYAAAMLVCINHRASAEESNPDCMRLVLNSGAGTTADITFSNQPVLTHSDDFKVTISASGQATEYSANDISRIAFVSSGNENSSEVYVNIVLKDSDTYSFPVTPELQLTYGKDEESNLPDLSFVPGEGCRPARTFLNVRLPEGKTYSFEVNERLSISFGENLEAADTESLHLKKNNIDAIVAAMSADDKANILVGGGYRGSISGYIDLWGQRVKGAAGDTDAFSEWGIPQIVLTDGPAGVRITEHNTTSFPCGLSLASMRDTTMVERVGAALGDETLEFGCDVLLAPGMNILRNPLCGRNFEYFSEDPVLSGKTAAAYIRGVQSQGVGCSAKHFCCNNQETGRKGNNSIVAEDVLRQLYFIPFEISARESKPWTFMTSYNKLNGTYTSENKWLITDILRGEWGWDGLVMSDWDDAHDTVSQLKAGNDLLMPGVSSQESDIKDAISDGTLSSAELDACVHRMLELIVKTPTFHGYKYSNSPNMTVHAALSREAAAKGTVLLKNEDNTLPLDVSKTGTVALFGANSYDLLSGGIGSGSVNTDYVIDIYQGLENAGFTLYSSLRSSYLNYAKWSWNRSSISALSTLAGMGQNPLKEKSIETTDISSAASASSVAIITIARQSGESADRSDEAGDFTLDTNETNLINNVCSTFHAQGKKVIVILNICGVIETASWKELPDAIICPWLPGLEGGNAIADVITGKAEPGGRLPMTFPISYADVPAQNFGDSDANEYTEGLNTGRTYYDANPDKVSYPYGWGLSYTSGLKGDVNADGKVNIVDVARLVSILDGRLTDYDLMKADLNLDGRVTSADLDIMIGFVK